MRLKPLQYLKDDCSGAVMVYIGVTIFLLLTFIGVSIDAGRAFMARSKAMAALDAAVLAAAGEISQLTIGSTPEETLAALNAKANEYFTTNFPAGYLGVNYLGTNPVTITYDQRDQRVSGTSNITIPMVFGAFHHTSTLRSGGFSQVQRQGTTLNVEIALVLDITASMCNLQNIPGANAPAGCSTGTVTERNSFARQCTERALTRMSSLRSSLTIFHEKIRDAVESARRVGPVGSIYIGAVFFDSYFKRERGTPQIQNVLRENPLRSTNTTTNPWAGANLRYFDSALPASVGLRPYNTSRDVILSRIAPRTGSPVAFMQCTGETQTQVGTFGAFQLLDPAMASYFNHVRAPGDARPSIPAAFGAQDNIKVVVLMTDGNNTRNVVTRVGGVPVLNTPEDTLANTRQAQYCETLKQNAGVVIYSIVFGNPPNAIKDVFRTCASNGGDGYYFEPNNGDELESAFANIADSIIDLRIRE
jgi:Flp pilus assembly protein TadG